MTFGQSSFFFFCYCVGLLKKWGYPLRLGHAWHGQVQDSRTYVHWLHGASRARERIGHGSTHKCTYTCTYTHTHTTKFNMFNRRRACQRDSVVTVILVMLLGSGRGTYEAEVRREKRSSCAGCLNFQWTMALRLVLTLATYLSVCNGTSEGKHLGDSWWYTMMTAWGYSG